MSFKMLSVPMGFLGGIVTMAAFIIALSFPNSLFALSAATAMIVGSFFWWSDSLSEKDVNRTHWLTGFSIAVVLGLLVIFKLKLEGAI